MLVVDDGDVNVDIVLSGVWVGIYLVGFIGKLLGFVVW